MFKLTLRFAALWFMALCLFTACVPLAFAADTGDSSAIESAVISDLTGDSSAASGSADVELVEGEITDAQFKSYVLGCLFFFVVVILFYFAYKLFAMFF